MEEKDLALDLRSATPCVGEPMPGDQNVVRVLVPEHLHTAKLRLDHNRVDTIRHEVLNPLGPGQRLSSRPAETDIMTEAGYGAAGLLAAQRPTFACSWKTGSTVARLKIPVLRISSRVGSGSMSPLKAICASLLSIEFPLA